MLLYGLLLSSLLLSMDHSFLVLTSLVLEPNPNYSWVEACDLNKMFFQESIRSRVGTINAS